MAALSLDALEKHISNLHAQLQYFSKALEATDHTTPDWITQDLVSVRNKSGRLHDEMQEFRVRLETRAPGTKKTSEKRLSLEGAHSTKISPLAPTNAPRVSSPLPPPAHSPSPASPSKPNNKFEVQHVDVSEEISRRLHESRLRRLMDSPSTSQKRKRDALEDANIESGGRIKDNDGGEELRSPVKRFKASGTFEPTQPDVGKPLARSGPHERSNDQTVLKKRRLWTSGSTSA